jgi:hypothetical protein
MTRFLESVSESFYKFRTILRVEPKEQLGRTETAQMRCFGAVSRYIMADHKNNEDTEDTRYQHSDGNCRKEWIEHL